MKQLSPDNLPAVFEYIKDEIYNYHAKVSRDVAGCMAAARINIQIGLYLNSLNEKVIEQIISDEEAAFYDLIMVGSWQYGQQLHDLSGGWNTEEEDTEVGRRPLTASPLPDNLAVKVAYRAEMDALAKRLDENHPRVHRRRFL
jgi:hypothetical protein